MTELETLLLQQLEQQQAESEQLVNGLTEQLNALFKQLEHCQARLETYHQDNVELRRDLERSDRQNAEMVDRLTARFETLTEQLTAFRMQ